MIASSTCRRLPLQCHDANNWRCIPRWAWSLITMMYLAAHRHCYVDHDSSLIGYRDRKIDADSTSIRRNSIRASPFNHPHHLQDEHHPAPSPPSSLDIKQKKTLGRRTIKETMKTWICNLQDLDENPTPMMHALNWNNIYQVHDIPKNINPTMHIPKYDQT